MPFLPDASLIGTGDHRRSGGLLGHHRRGGRLWHRRADAADPGADGRRRAGGADHRHFGDVHQHARGCLAFRRMLEPRRAVIAVVCALPTCILGAWLYTLLSGRGAALVIGTSLIATVPLRRLLKRRGHRLGEKGYAAAAAGWGIVVGGSTGAGVILLSLLMASGLEGAAVIATDAAVSIGMGVVKISVFGAAGVLTPKVAGDRAVDQRRGISLHFSGEAHRRADAGACAHRCARRRRSHRRHGDDFECIAIGNARCKTPAADLSGPPISMSWRSVSRRGVIPLLLLLLPLPPRLLLLLLLPLLLLVAFGQLE